MAKKIYSYSRLNNELALCGPYLANCFDIDGFCWGIDISTIVKHRQKGIGSEAENVNKDNNGKDKSDAVTTLTH